MLCAAPAARPSREVGVRRVLAVDDEPAIRRLLTAILERGGYEAVVAADARQALEEVGRGNLDAVVLDIAKLLDPPQTNKKDNLSLAGAIELLPPDRRDELRVKLKALRRELASVLEHRHRRIAHNDRAVALDLEQAGGVTVGGITDAIRKVAGFLDEIGW